MPLAELLVPPSVPRSVTAYVIAWAGPEARSNKLKMVKDENNLFTVKTPQKMRVILNGKRDSPFFAVQKRGQSLSQIDSIWEFKRERRSFNMGIKTSRNHRQRCLLFL
jgi:hypothetical protein